MEVLSIHNVNTSNIGDLNAAPYLYFPFLKGNVLDINHACLVENAPKICGKFVVVGGGGLIDYSHFMSRGSLSSLDSLNPVKLVAWGLGTNTNTFCPNYTPIKRFDMIGLRDWGTGFDWVPCVSCMSHLFDEALLIKPTNQIVAYWHKDERFEDRTIPCILNSWNKVSEVLSFLASGETVMTNTYHGVYWATLLGRKVVCVHPFSSRFLYMKHRPVFADWSNMLEVAKRAIRYPDALEECRDANLRFSVKVRNLLEV